MRRRRRLGLLLSEFLQHVMTKALQLISPAHHHLTRRIDGGRIRRVQKEHRCRCAGVERFFIHLAQQIAHVHRHVTKININRARRQTFVAHGAMVGDVFEFFPVFDRDTASGLLFIQEGFHQQGRGENFIAWRIEQVRTWHVGGTHWFAFAAAQAVFDAIGNGANIALLHDQRFVSHQAKRWRVGIAQISRQFNGIEKLALVEASLRIDPLFVVAEVAHFRVGQVFELGDTNTMLARDNAVQRSGQGHNAVDRRMRVLQHVVVIGIDRDICVHIAVTCVHVQGDEHAAAQHTFVDDRAFFQNLLERRAIENQAQDSTHFVFPRHANGAILQYVEQRCIRLLAQTRRNHRRKFIETDVVELGFCCGQRQIQIIQQPCPTGVYGLQQLLRFADAIFQQLGGRNIIAFSVVAFT